MKTLTLLSLMLGAGAAQAHTGAHLHPHDGAGWLALAGGLALIALASLAVGLRR